MQNEKHTTTNGKCIFHKEGEPTITLNFRVYSRKQILDQLPYLYYHQNQDVLFNLSKIVISAFKL